MHTRLGLETIKVSGIDLKRQEVAVSGGGGGGEGEERESARGKRVGNERGVVQEEGCYERCVQLTVAGSDRAEPLATGVVNARGIPTYLRQFLFMADPPSPQGRWGRSFSLIGIELLFSFINDAGNPSSMIFYQCYHHRAEGKGLSQTVSTLLSHRDQIKQKFILYIISMTYVFYK